MRSHVTASPAGSTQCQAAGLRRGQALLALLAVLAGILALLAANASAAITREPESFSPIGGSSVGLTLHSLSGIAVDETTGNVFISDGEGGSGGEGVVILGGEGGTPAGLVSPFKIPNTVFFHGNTPAFLAYDNSSSSAKGTLYAYNNEGSIRKYVRNAGTETFEEVSGGSIAVPGCGLGSGGGIDAEGNVYFGCPGLHRVYVFSPAGTMLHNYDLSGTPVTSPGQIAVDAASDLFVQQQAGGLYKFPANGSGEIEPSNYQLVASGAWGVAYEPEANEIVVSEEGQVEEFDATTLARIGGFGREVLSGGRSSERLALNLKTHRAYVVSYGSRNIAVFGPDVIVPTLTVKGASNITGTKATLNGSVDPEGIEVTDCFFEYGPTTSYGHKASCDSLPPADSETHAVSANIVGLTPNGVTYHYRLVAKNENGTERSPDRTLVTGNTSITKEATGIGTSSAILHGIVRPEGTPFSDCEFEYKRTTEASFEEADCVPPASAIEADFDEHPVSAALTKLQPNSTYEFRLSATNTQGTVTGEVLTFTTPGPPQITEVRALNASQGAANIEGKINPSGFGTSYRFEWGPTASYGNQVPADFEPFLGEGSKPVRVSAKLNGLAAGQAYHYRIVASSSAGTTATPDQVLETLNSCGLPEERCFELVSRREAGPVAIPGQTFSPSEVHFQAATTPGALAYVVEAGYPDATKAGEVLYRGTRGPSGWESTQLSARIVAPNEQAGVGSVSSNTQFLSNDLSCGFMESSQPLTEDPSTRLAIEDGGSNLYRINPDGSYTAVSKLAPENSGSVIGGGRNNYAVLGASEDCGKALFSSRYTFPGIAGEGSPTRLYEWDEGMLRNVGVIPGPSGEEVVVEATAAEGQGTVSEDGSRIFFSAKRQASSNPEEIGSKAVFVREDGGASVRDVSLSQTGTPDKGATYQWATPDGSRVFFTANAGLTDESSPAGTDLYEYDLETEELADRSASQVPGGAQVAGFVGGAKDGSRVYFVSQAQLVPGRGKTQAENQSANTYSVYGESNGGVSFVGTIRGFDLSRVTVGLSESARVSPDGRYLLFPSTANVTGYEGGGSSQAYLYDAQGGSEGTTCVSCRQDGQPSVARGGVEPYEVLSEYQAANSPQHPLQFLIMHEGEPRVFFNSPDSLAPGAEEGQNNVYEWAHGQVFRLASAVENQDDPPFSGYGNAFVGASEDGSDVYFFTPRTLNWEDGDERLSVYDARVGGGFLEPAAPAAPCEATSEGSCQGPAQGAPAIGGAASAAFNGPGNPPEPKQKKSKKKPHKKKHAKKKSKGKKKGKKGKQARKANGNRRAGK